MGPLGSTLAVAPLFSFHRAVRRRPAEHEDVIVETTRFAATLGVRLTGGQRDKQHEIADYPNERAVRHQGHPLGRGLRLNPWLGCSPDPQMRQRASHRGLCVDFRSFNNDFNWNDPLASLTGKPRGDFKKISP